MEGVRRSKRARIPVDYARLDETGFSDCARVQHRRLARAVLRWPDSNNGESTEPYSVSFLSAEQLSPVVHETGFRRPCVVRRSDNTPGDLGIRLPEGDITIQKLAELIGPRLINTIDVATQSEGPVYSMEEWVTYFTSPSPRKPLLNVVSLDLSETPLQDMISPPSLVKELDLVGKAWPCNHCPVPKVQLYALLSVADCFMDFHIDFGGSSVWYHVLSGRKVFLLVPPTKGNLLMFEEWASSEKQASVFFGDRALGCQKVELFPGDTLFLPGGWPHSVVTPIDSLVIGGNFLTGYNLLLQLEVWNMEERLKVRPKFRFPFYKPLMWHTASYYLELLLKTCGNKEATITQWEMEGIAVLWRSLQSWLQQSHEDVPDQISDPTLLLEDFRDCLGKLGHGATDLLKKSSMKVRVLLRAETSLDVDMLSRSTSRPCSPHKEQSVGSDRDYSAGEDEGEDGTDDDCNMIEDVENERKHQKSIISNRKVQKTLQGHPEKDHASSFIKAGRSVKKLTKSNSTVRDRILKKIGLDPRIPLPYPKYRPKLLES
eukprot:c27877_g1_i2 orf=388-2019(-)